MRSFQRLHSPMFGQHVNDSLRISVAVTFIKRFRYSIHFYFSARKSVPEMLLSVKKFYIPTIKCANCEFNAK